MGSRSWSLCCFRSTMPPAPKSGDRPARRGVEGHELVADGDEVDPLVAGPVGPVPDAAPGQAPHRSRGALPFVEAVHPEVLAGGRVERHDRAPAAGGGVEHAVDDERRRLQVVVGARTQVPGLVAPDDLQVAEVAGVDLIERRVARRAEVSRPRAPLAAGRAVLRRGGARRRGTLPRPGASKGRRVLSGTTIGRGVTAWAVLRAARRRDPWWAAALEPFDIILAVTRPRAAGAHSSCPWPSVR